MAARFWVGGTGNWDSSDTTHWASTSGGSGGVSVPGSGDTVTLDASSGGGTVTVATNPSITSLTGGAFTGTFDLNGKTLTNQTFNWNGSGVRTFNANSGIINISSTGATTVFQNNTTNNTWNGSTLTLTISTTTANTRTFIFGALNYGTFNYIVSGSTGEMDFQEAAGPTFVNFNFYDASNARTVKFPSFFTVNITGSCNIRGTSGKLMSIIGTTAGTQATLNCTGDRIATDYLSIKDSKITGQTAYAGTHSTNVSNNTSWTFTDPPRPSGGSTLLGVG